MSIKKFLIGSALLYGASKLIESSKKKENGMNGYDLSGYNIIWFHIIPVRGKFTKADKRKLGRELYNNPRWFLIDGFGKNYVTIHIHISKKKDYEKLLKNICLSKQYYVLYYTDKQFGYMKVPTPAYKYWADIDFMKKQLTKKQRSEIFKIKSCRQKK